MKTCPQCGGGNGDAATFCSQCGTDLTQAAVNWNCPACSSLNPMASRFCSTCGTKRAEAAPASRGAAPAAPAGGRTAGGSAAKTMFFSSMQQQGQAKLVLVRGGEWEGVSYMLNADHHLTGREDGFIVFSDDPFVSAFHCDFYYGPDGRFMLADQGSLNGVYTRIKAATVLRSGDFLRIGEQLFRFDIPEQWPAIEGLKRVNDGTQVFGSPAQAVTGMPRLEHILEGGQLGAVYLLDREAYTVGREGCTLSFPTDRFISGRHARIFRDDEKGWQIEDIGSKNGTFVRVGAEPAQLVHGDYVFVGQQLLRVEIV